LTNAPVTIVSSLPKLAPLKQQQQQQKQQQQQQQQPPLYRNTPGKTTPRFVLFFSIKSINLQNKIFPVNGFEK
jgi:hypothetical protein